MSILRNQEDNTYAWTFKNVNQIWEVEGKSLISAPFSMKIHEVCTNWALIITENNQQKADNRQSSKSCTHKRKAEEQYIALYIENFKYDTLLQRNILRLRFAIINPIEGEVHAKSKTILYPREKQTYGFSEFITVDHLKKLGFQDLTIHCTIEIVQKDLESYKPLLCNHRFNDVKIIIGDETYPAHKLILSMSSRVFQKKFGAEDSIYSVKINCVKPEIFKELLKFMYTGTVDNMETLASEFFAAATTYQICALQKKCKEFLIANLKQENVVSTVLLSQISVDEHARSLQEKCIDFVARDLKTMIKSGVCKDLGEKDPEFLRDVVKYLEKSSTFNKVTRSDVLLKSVPTCNTCLEVFETYLNNKTLSDVTIHVGDKKFFAHRLILSGRSPVFKRMFENEMKETISGIVEVEDIEPDVFYELLRFMYTNKINNIENSVSDILIAADKYDVDDLKVKVENILRNKLAIENVSNIFLIADRVNSTGLKEECLCLIIDYIFFRSQISYPMLDKTLKALDVHFLLELLTKIARDYIYILKSRYDTYVEVLRFRYLTIKGIR